MFWFFLILVIAIAVVAMRIVPSALEYMAIKSAVEKVVTSGAPSARELQEGMHQQLRDMEPEDLLGRAPVQLDL